MASVPTQPYVPVAEYLNTSYRPDLEYVDGVLMERSSRTILQALLQASLCHYFAAFEIGCRFVVLPRVRTEIVRFSEYRLPDVQLCAVPGPSGRIMDAVPMAVIEIFSPADTMSEMLERFRDYAAIGTPYIIQLDPENCIARRFDKGSLIETEFTALEIGDRKISFDSKAIFETLRAKHRQFTGEDPAR